MRSLSALIVAGTLALASAVPSHAAVIRLTASLDGAQETPPNASPGTGSATMEFDDATNVLSWSISYSLATGPATAAHFHGRRVPGPAGPGIASPTQFDIVGIVGTFSGVVFGSFDFDVDAFLGPAPGTAGTLTRDQRINELLDDLWYINIHTATFPAGEIRGQAIVPEPASLALLGLGLLGLAGMRRRSA